MAQLRQEEASTGRKERVILIISWRFTLRNKGGATHELRWSGGGKDHTSRQIICSGRAVTLHHNNCRICEDIQTPLVLEQYLNILCAFCLAAHSPRDAALTTTSLYHYGSRDTTNMNKSCIARVSAFGIDSSILLSATHTVTRLLHKDFTVNYYFRARLPNPPHSPSRRE
jgi:hypothetical protein